MEFCRLKQLGTLYAALQNLEFMNAALLLKSLPTPGLDKTSVTQHLAIPGTFRPGLHGNGSMWNRTSTVRINLSPYSSVPCDLRNALW